MKKAKKVQKSDRRLLARNLAHNLSMDELESITGGLVGTSTPDTCSGGCLDDSGPDD